MIVIRQKVFETNSSSTHAVCILPKEDYTKLKGDPDLWYNEEFGVCTLEEVKKHLSPWQTDSLKEIEAEAEKNGEEVDYVSAIYEVADEEWYNVNMYDDNDAYYEQDIHEYTTKSGDNIVVVCNYGRDG